MSTCITVFSVQSPSRHSQLSISLALSHCGSRVGTCRSSVISFDSVEPVPVLSVFILGRMAVKNIRITSTQNWRKSTVKFNTRCFKEWALFSGPGFTLSVHSEY